MERNGRKAGKLVCEFIIEMENEEEPGISIIMKTGREFANPLDVQKQKQKQHLNSRQKNSDLAINRVVIASMHLW